MFNNSTDFTMPVMPAYGSGYSNGGMFGGDGLWGLIIILALLGWGNGGFGGFGGGFGGSRGCVEPCATKADLTAQGIVQKLDGTVAKTYTVPKKANHIIVFVSTASARSGATRNVKSSNPASVVASLSTHSTSSRIDYGGTSHGVFNYSDVYLIENLAIGDVITISSTVSSTTNEVCVTQIGEIVYID